MHSIIYGQNMFIAVGEQGRIVTSTDGINWTDRTSGTTEALYQVRYLNGHFYAVGNKSTILRSADGITWTKLYSMEWGSLIRTISYGNDIYVALAGDGTTYISADGLTWEYNEVRQFYGRYPTDMIFDGENFIAASGDVRAISSDGKNWTIRIYQYSDHLSTVAYGNSNIVEVGYQGQVHVNYARHYSAYNSISDQNTLYSVRFLNGQFLAVGDQGTVLSSIDGITWVKHDVAEQTSMYDIAFGDGKFIVVGMNGLITQIDLNSDPPVAADGTNRTNQNVPVSGQLEVANPDAISAKIYSLVNKPSHGSVTISPNGEYTYTPQLDFAGVDSFTFTVSDGTTVSSPATVLIDVIPVVAAPVSDPASGSVISPQSVIKLTSATPGATIYYALDYKEPDTNSMSGNIVQINRPKGSRVVIKAFAVKPGMVDSEVATFTFTVSNDADLPTAYPSGGEVVVNSEIVVSTDTMGAILYYTTDGSTPTAESQTSGSFMAYIPVEGEPGDSFTIKAVALKPGMTDSPVATFTYTVISESDQGESITVSGVTSGGVYSTDRVITFDRGTATLNGMPFNSGDRVSEEGHYTLHIQVEGSRVGRTIYFVIDKTPPVISGVQDGGVYEGRVTISYDEGRARLNGRQINSGSVIDTPGTYTLEVTDYADHKSVVRFEIIPEAIDYSELNIQGVIDGGVYDTERYITFERASAILNGELFRSGDVVREDGQYSLIVMGYEGLVITINFTIQKPSPIRHLQGVSDWAVGEIEAANESGLTSPVENLTFSDHITREQFAAIAVQLYQLIKGEAVPTYTDNPFTDTDHPAVISAYHLGIVMGTGEQQFSPSLLINREQLALMLTRVLERTDITLPTGEEKTFTDQDSIASYAYDAVMYMASLDVIQGTAQQQFAPKSHATVEQAVIMSKRLLDKIPPSQRASLADIAASEDEFELIIDQQYPRQDGTIYNVYALTNHSEFTLQPYSALYITAGTSERIPFETEYENYHYGGYLVVSNQSASPMTFQAGEIKYLVSRFYADKMGTITESDGTSYPLVPTGPYIRIISFDGPFDEHEGYKTYIENGRVIELGDWTKVEKAP